MKLFNRYSNINYYLFMELKN